jgi:hypothetical protein
MCVIRTFHKVYFRHVRHTNVTHSLRHAYVRHKNVAHTLLYACVSHKHTNTQTLDEYACHAYVTHIVHLMHMCVSTNTEFTLGMSIIQNVAHSLLDEYVWLHTYPHEQKTMHDVPPSYKNVLHTYTHVQINKQTSKHACMTYLSATEICHTHTRTHTHVHTQKQTKNHA